MDALQMTPVPQPPPSPASDEPEERRARIRAELEAEHQARLARFRSRSERAREEKHAVSASRERKTEEDLRQAERLRFFKEQGYKEYVDSNGRREWLPPEEYNWRMRRRKQRDTKGREYTPAILKRRQELVLYGIAALLAILVGLVLAR